MNAPKSPLIRQFPFQGMSFEIADLMIAQAWSEYHHYRMVVELDSYTDDEEYEEVLVFYPPERKFRRWSMWRTNNDIVVQPTNGRRMHFASVAEAMEALILSRV